MNTAFIMIKRNVKIFFKDKGMFFTTLITPVILLVLYVTFLGKIYKDNFILNIPQGLDISERIIDGLVGGQLISSILAVCCITVAFGSNFLMVQDKANGVIKDLRISPTPSYVFSLSYYAAALISTLIICFAAALLCFSYVAFVGWYMSVADVLLILLDVILLVLFGMALSSIINFFLGTQAQISAVGTIVSSGYGFICGAYMPLSSFGDGLRSVISFLPGTYGTALLRNHALRGACQELLKSGVPSQSVEALKDAIDCNIYIFGNKMPLLVMYIVLTAIVILLIGAYVLINSVSRKSK